MLGARHLNICNSQTVELSLWRQCTQWDSSKFVVQFPVWAEDDRKHFTDNKAVVCAISASYISTFAGYPVSSFFHTVYASYAHSVTLNQLDSLKSRLQTTKHRISVPKLALQVYREEGVIGFYRGLWIPLMTISFVRACHPFAVILWLCWECGLGAASFTIYTRTKEYFRNHHLLERNRMIDVAATGGIRQVLRPIPQSSLLFLTRSVTVAHFQARWSRLEVLVSVMLNPFWVMFLCLS